LWDNKSTKAVVIGFPQAAKERLIRVEDTADAVHSFAQGALPFLCLVVVNKTMAGEDFQKVLAKLPGDQMLFVGDECHRHGAVGTNAALPRHARARLGLSATPEDYLNADANARLMDYYGQIGGPTRCAKRSMTACLPLIATTSNSST
jgi:superfamily II DNA or RNA helicase